MTSPITIDLGNSMSRVQAPKELIGKLQWFVAYQEVLLPPPAVQGLIRKWLGPRRRQGYEAEIGPFFASTEGAEAQAQGWSPHRLTIGLWEQTLKHPGNWDGWRALVTDAGWFRTGLLADVQRAITLRMGLEVKINDQRQRPAPGTPLGRRPELWPFQADAVQAFHASGRGVINLPPRSGKTRIALAVVHDLGLPAVMVVPTLNLVDQTVEEAQRWLPPGAVVGLTGGAPNGRARRAMGVARLWVTTPGTAAGPRGQSGQGNGTGGKVRRGGMEGLPSRAVMVIDESHHGASSMYRTISDTAINAYYRLFLTGTDYRADGMDLTMRSVTGRPLYRRTVVDMVDQGRLAPARIGVLRIGGKIADEQVRLYGAGVVEYEPRNAALAYAAHQLMLRGKRVLVIAKEIAHTEHLASRIPGAVAVDGRDNERVRPALKALERGEIRCVVGTSVIGEGVDVPAADALVYAAGGRSKVKHVQDFFRVLTANAGKSHGVVIDVADDHHPKLTESAAHRLAMYRAMFGADVVNVDQFDRWLRAVA